MRSKHHEEGLEFVNFEDPTRSKPVSHQGVDPPLCEKCTELQLSFFDPDCPQCFLILQNPQTTISQIFAIIRQWMPQVQKNIDLFIREVLKRGGHVNDRDALTDMTMLHYASKSGANGVGDVEVACNAVAALINKGADFSQKCRWTDMLPLHYATFFDIAPVIDSLLNASKSADADCSCKEFENGTPLHIACLNLCYEAAKCLLEHKANPMCKNAAGKTPRQCLPKAIPEEEKTHSVILKLQSLLVDAENFATHVKREGLSASTLHALGLAIGDDVVISGQLGVLRYCGSTDFATGQWAGIALNEAVGKNDGTVAGVQYFHCKSKHGIFAPISRVTKWIQRDVHLKSDESYVSSDGSENSGKRLKLKIDDEVVVAGQKQGVVRFIGTTGFASGIWVGVELKEPSGKNDGSVSGRRYFHCEMNYGIFAPSSKVNKLTSHPNLCNNTEVGKFDCQLGERNESVVPISKSSACTENSVSRAENDHSDLDKLPLRSSEKAEKPNGNQVTRQRHSEMDFASHDSFRLKTGMSVYVNNELAIIRYIGNVQFADGIWLGVELRKPVGKNDGSVGDHRYFTCKPSYGLLIRPSRATCRGISCSQLLPAL